MYVCMYIYINIYAPLGSSLSLSFSLSLYTYIHKDLRARVEQPSQPHALPREPKKKTKIKKQKRISATCEPEGTSCLPSPEKNLFCN
jgi:hypothetical protein